MRTKVQKQRSRLPFWLLACVMTLTTANVWAQPWTYNGNDKITQGSVSLNVSANGTELTIGKNASFDGTTLDLPDEVHLDDPSDQTIYTIVAIGANAFDKTPLTSITLPNTLKTIGQMSFRLSKLNSVEIPSSVETIGLGAFYECSSLKTVILNNGLKEIGDDVFSLVPITKIEFPTSLTKLGNHAFLDCKSLASITFPVGCELKSIGKSAFSGCDDLNEVYCLATKEPTIGQRAFVSSSTRKVYATEVTGGWNYSNWGLSSAEQIIYKVPETKVWTYNGSDKIIKGKATLSVSRVDTELTITDDDDISGTTLELPDEIPSINPDDQTIYTIVAIGESAFKSTPLTSITLPNTLKTIGKESFKWSKLTSVEIPSSVETIGESAFFASKAKTVTFNNGLKNIGERAFQEMPITEIEFPSSLTTLDASAFSACGSLASISFPADCGLISIGKSAFNNCNKVESVSLPGQLEEIGENAFIANTSLKSISLPSTIKKIGGSAFSSCSNLNEVYCSATTEPEIGSRAFASSSTRKVHATAVTGGWTFSDWGLDSDAQIIYKPSFAWTYDATTGKMARKDGKDVFGATAANNELTITSCDKLEDTPLVLDLKGTIVSAADLTTEFTLKAIGDGVFASIDIKSMYLDAATPLKAVAGSFATASKEKGLLFVPKGSLSDYKAAEGWKEFRYILEEGNEAYAVNFEGLTNLSVKDYEPLYALGGQKLAFTLKAADDNFGLPQAIKAYMNGSSTEAVADTDYSYDPATGNVVILKDATCTWKFVAAGVGIILPEGDKEVTIKDNNNYTEGDTDKEYASTLDGTNKTISKLTIGETGGTEIIKILFKEITVDTPANPDDYSTTINAGTTAIISLQGNINLGTLQNDGELTFMPAPDAAASISPDMTIQNNSIFRDETALVTKVIGDADMTITPLTNQSILAGSTKTLTVTASTDRTGATISYAWEKQNEDGTWPSDLPRAFSLRSADTHEYDVTEAGTYRCLITTVNSDNSVRTTLTAISKVTTYTETPTQYYDVTLPEVEGATTNPGAGIYSVSEGDSFSFTLTLDEDYDQSAPIVKVGDKVIELNSDGKYQISGIYANQTIAITGIVKNAPVSNAVVEDSEARVWTANGRLCISSPKPCVARVFTFGGVFVRELNVSAGEQSYTLGTGTYIIRLDKKSYKIRM